MQTLRRGLIGGFLCMSMLVLGGCPYDEDVPPPPDPNKVEAGTATTIAVSDTKSPIYGTSILFPANAFGGGTIHVDIGYENAPPAPLPAPAVIAGGVFVSKTFVLTHDQTPGISFDVPLEVTVPFDTTVFKPGDLPTVLFWDEAAAGYQAVSLYSFDLIAKRLTFRTAHLSKYIIATIPGLGGAASGGTALAGGLSVDTGMLPSADSFFRSNIGSYSSSGGNCLGMSSYADWYFERAKVSQDGGTGLFAQYLEGNPALPADDITAEELIVRAHAAASQEWGRRLVEKNALLSSDQVAASLVQAMKLTGLPQLFLMFGNPSFWEKYVLGKASWGHATVVYKYDETAGAFSYYDPNARGDDAAGIRYVPGTGFGTLLKAGSLPTEPDQFGFDSINSVYSPGDMQALHDGAAAGWSDGKYGHFDITSLTIDPVTRIAPAEDRNNVALKGKLVSVGGEVGKEPNKVDVFVAGTLVATHDVASNGDFDFVLPPLADGVTSEILLVGRRAETTGFFVQRTKSLYGTFTRFKVRIGTVLENWGFEQGSFNLWDSTRFLWGGGDVVTPSDKSEVVTAGTDPIATSIPQVLFGTYAARVNNSDNNYHISDLTREVVVPASATTFSLAFSWAAVLEDPAHDAADQPYIAIDVTVPATGEVLYQRRYYSNDPTFPGWKEFAGGDWKAIDWQAVNLPGLERLKGQTILIKVEAADCALGGHGGYAYLDAEE